MLWQTWSTKKKKVESGGGGEAEGKEVPSRKICASTSVWVRQQALTEAALPTQSSRKTSCRCWGSTEPQCPEEAGRGGPL